MTKTTTNINQEHAGASNGFTLVEALVGLSVGVLVAAAGITLFVINVNTFHLLSITTNSSKGASNMLEELVYGVDGGNSLRSSANDDIQLLEEENGGGWRLQIGLDDAGQARHLTFDPELGEIVDQQGRVLVDGIIAAEVTHTNQGVSLEVTVTEQGRRQTATTTMRSFVRCRN